MERMREGPISDEQKEWYYRQFPRLPGHIAGEWTPRYMAMPPHAATSSPGRPAAKLLTIVREPIERYRSGLKQWQGEQAPIAEAG